MYMFHQHSTPRPQDWGPLLLDVITDVCRPKNPPPPLLIEYLAEQLSDTCSNISNRAIHPLYHLPLQTL